MKKIILSTVLMAIVLVSCNQKNKQEETLKSEATENASQSYSCPMHPEVIGKQGEACSKCGMELTEPVSQAPKTTTNSSTEATPETTTTSVVQSSFSINEIVGNYLQLKNALAKDDSKSAANAGKALFATFNGVNTNSIDAKLKKEYLEIADDAKENSEHIGDNAGKIDHQREHFAMLSKDVNDLIKIFGTSQKLYQDYCPMYDEGKSGYWISETKEIKNPYFGKQMLNCGTIKKEW